MPLDVRHLGRNAPPQAVSPPTLGSGVSEFTQASELGLIGALMLLMLAAGLGAGQLMPLGRMGLVLAVACTTMLLWYAGRRVLVARSLLNYWWLALMVLCVAQMYSWWELLLSESAPVMLILIAAAAVAVSLAPLLFRLGGYLLVLVVLGLSTLLPGVPEDSVVHAYLLLLVLLLAGLVSARLLHSRRTVEAREALLRRDVVGLRAELDDRQQRILYEQDQRQAVQRDLEAVRELADSAGRAKTEFLATISHEIRTPLNGILPILEILQDTRLDADQQRYVRTAFSSSRHLLRIINDILDFAKAESGKLLLENIEIDLREQVRAVIELMQSSADNKGLRLSLDIEEGIPDVLRCDPIRLRQILINLLSNAIKFTDSGEVRLSVERGRSSRKEIELTFSVSDTGVGMTRDTARKLFQSFTQADASTTRKHGGTGLGLAICKRLVDLMGGKIGVRSRVGEGSTFWFALPMRRSVRDVPSARADLQGVRVLFSISDADSAEEVQRLLESWGVAVECSEPGEAAGKLEQAAMLGSTWGFDLLLLDTWGAEQQVDSVLREVRNTAALKGLPMVVAGRSDKLLERLHHDYAVHILPGGGLQPAPLRRCLYRVLDVEGVVLRGDNAGEVANFRDLNLEKEFALHDVFEHQADALDESDVKGRVLLVEDNPVNLGVMRRVLERQQVKVLVAHNGREALEQLAGQKVDLVFMDCQMPVMDGYAATGEWRRIEGADGRPRLPIVAMTANAMQGDREKCLDAGMDDYLAKPVSVAQVQEQLRKWLPDYDGVAQAPRAAGIGKPLHSDAILDEAVQAELREVMEDGFDDLVRTYLDNTPTLVRELQQAAQADDLDGMVVPAHSIKSSSANLGAMPLSQLARSIEMAARQQQQAEAMQAYAQLEQVYADTCEALRKLL